MYYTIYKTTNKVNGKFYVGTHKTRNLDDGYYGSGKYLKRAIEKHGIDNFEKEILFVFDNPEEMFAKEAEIVNEDFLAEENTYNLKVGGFGGFDYINSKADTVEYKEVRRKNMIVTNKRFSHENNNRLIKAREVFNEKLRLNGGAWWNTATFTGKKHTDETKKKMSIKAKARLSDPTKNSQYGTRWIHSLEEKRSRKIKKDDPLPAGWIEGRKIKF